MAIVYGSAGFRIGLLSSIGQYLESQGVAKWSSWLATDTAITIDVLPATPDKAIALTLYPVSSSGTDVVMGLQLRIRGKPGNRTEDKTILDRAEDALDGLSGIDWAGVPIVLVELTSGAYLGQDANNRPEHTANYYITLTREGLNRKD